jgi:hypothetical protein
MCPIEEYNRPVTAEVERRRNQRANEDPTYEQLNQLSVRELESMQADLNAKIFKTLAELQGCSSRYSR